MALIMPFTIITLEKTNTLSKIRIFFNHSRSIPFEGQFPPADSVADRLRCH